MKSFKRTTALFAAALLCLVFFFNLSLTAKAEGPVTYSLRYVDSINQWRYQTGTWQDSGFYRELYYMEQDIKDGDIIVIDGTKPLDLTLNVRLSNLTIVNSTDTVVTAKSFDEVFVLNSSVCAINGDVTKASVYANSVTNFNNNVGELNLLEAKQDLLRATVAVVGTVNHVYAAGQHYKHFEFYNFEANSLLIQNGTLKTDASKYSTTPSAATPAPAPSTPAAPGTSGEYDDVPKTADVRFNPLWLVGIAAVCMAGAYKLKEEK